MQAAADTFAVFLTGIGVPLPFVIVIDAVTEELHSLMPWTLIKLCSRQMTSTTSSDRRSHGLVSTAFRLRLNVKKTEYTAVNQFTTVYVECNGVTTTDFFKSLGSTLSADGNLDTMLSLVSTLHFNVTWYLAGVLRDKKVSVRFKSMVYSTIVWSVAMYGAKCRPVATEVERRHDESKDVSW